MRTRAARVPPIVAQAGRNIWRVDQDGRSAGNHDGGKGVGVLGSELRRQDLKRHDRIEERLFGAVCHREFVRTPGLSGLGEYPPSDGMT